MVTPKVSVVSDFKSYRPPPRVERSIRRVLSFLERESMVGLHSIVLTDQGKYAPTRRNDRDRLALGFYHQGTDARRPWIELLVDNIFAGVPQWVLRLGIVRELLLAAPLLHEIAHHRNSTMGGMRSQSHEVRADEWAAAARRRYFRRKYWYLTPFARLFVGAVRIVRRRRA